MESRSDYFDSIAEKWDGFGDLDVLRLKLEAGRERLSLDGASDVLDLGCGTGNLTGFLLERASDLSTLFAVDFSAKMLEVATRKILDPRVRWLHEDARDLSLKDESVDLVICFSTWPHFPDPVAVLGEVHRILRPGAKLVIYHVESRETINGIHRGVGGLIGEDLLISASDLAALLSREGFTIVSVVDSHDEYLVCGSKGP